MTDGAAQQRAGGPEGPGRPRQRAHPHPELQDGGDARRALLYLGAQGWRSREAGLL